MTEREFRHNSSVRIYASDDAFSGEIQGLAMAILELQEYAARQTEAIGRLTAGLNQMLDKLKESRS